MNTLKQTFQKQIIFIFYLQPLSSLHLKNHACNRHYMSENPWKSKQPFRNMASHLFSLQKSLSKKEQDNQKQQIPRYIKQLHKQNISISKTLLEKGEKMTPKQHIPHYIKQLHKQNISIFKTLLEKGKKITAKQHIPHYINTTSRTKYFYLQNSL